MTKNNSLYKKLKLIISDYINECYDASLFISIPSIILDYNDDTFNIKNYNFEHINCIELENSSCKYINGVHYDEIWRWERILEEFLNKININFQKKCKVEISLKIPYLLLYNKNISITFSECKSELCFDNNPIPYAYIMVEVKNEENEKFLDVEMIIENFLEENTITFKKNSENYDKTFTEYGLDSLQLSLLEYKLHENFKNKISFEPLFLLKNNTPNKIIKYIKEKSFEKTDEIKNNVNKMKLVPTWSQKRFLFFKKLNSKIFEEMVEGIKICFKYNETLVKQIQDKINYILSHINILRTTINDQNTLLRLSRTETFILLYKSKNKMKKKVNFDNNQLPLKIKISERNNSFFLTILLHHIVADGKSFEFLLNYLINREICSFEKYNYDNYQETEEQYQKDNQFKLDKQYFRQLLNNVELTENKYHLFEKKVIGFLNFRIPVNLTNVVKEISMKYDVSIFSIFITIYKILYYKIYGNSNVGIGIPCENRPNYKFYNTIGPFINVLPFFCKIDSNLTIKDIVTKNNEIFQECISHKQFPYDEIISLVKEKGKNLFDTMFIQEPARISKKDYMIYKLKPSYLESNEIWTFTQETSTFNVNVKFDKEIINENQIKSWIEGFLLIIKQLDDSLNVYLKNFNIYKNLSVENRILKKDFIKNSDLYYILNNQINLKNFKVIEEENDKIYWIKDILLESSKLAHQIEQYYFRNNGEINTPDTPVVICFERCISLIKVILALSFSNFAAFPINLKTTFHQHQEIENSLYIDEHILREINCNEIENSQNRKNCRKNTDIFYLTSTSGSTGKPKIVCSELKGLLNLITSYTKMFFINDYSTIYQVVNHSFDIFFIDIFQAFFNGSNIILAKSKIPDLSNFLKYQISHAYIMPAYLERLDKHKIKQLSQIEVLLYGGECLKKEILEILYKLSKKFKIFQEFGLTEHSIYTNSKQMRIGSNLKEIGSCFQNTGCGVIDNDKKFLLPCESGGNNFVTFGEGVSRGYIYNKNKKNCFANLSSNIKCLLTGDIVSFDQKNQAFIFCCRNDSFIKINGQQINISSVEDILLKLFPIKNVYVTLYTNKITKIKFLVAHYTGVEIFEFKNILRNHIPVNWIPQYYLYYKEFPLNSNGKIDKNLLNQIDLPVINNEKNTCDSNVYIKYEKEILKVFKYYLSSHKITANDNIFDKGANSIILMMIVQDLESKYGIKIHLKDFFKYKSVADLQKNNCITLLDKINSESFFIKQKTFKNVPLTYGQKYMWFTNEFSSTNDEYVIQWKVTFTKKLSLHKIKYIVQSLMKLNITLRTVFVKEKFKLTQQAFSMTECFLNYQFNKEQVDLIFNLSEDIPFKINVISNKQFWIAFHHISVDGFSFKILKEQIINLFNDTLHSFKNNEIVSYFDYALEYDKKWQNYFENVKPNKNLVYQKKLVENFETIVHVDFQHINADNYFSVLLYALGQSLRKYSNNEIVIHIPIMNRPNKFLKTVGYFVETFPFVLKFEKNNHQHNLSIIKNDLTTVLSKEIPPYQYQMNEELHKQLNYQKFSFMLILDNFNLDNIIKINNELSVEITEKNTIVGKFDQTWAVKILKNALKIQIEYNKNYFSLEQIKEHVENFKLTVRALIRTDLSYEILRLTKECLKIEDEIDTTKTFFELGGNSISGALLCSTIRQELKIPCNVQMLFELPILQKFIDKLLQQQPKINDEEKIKNNKKHLNLNNIQFNPFVIPIIKFMEKHIQKPKMNRRYNNYIEIKLESRNNTLLTYNINYLLKIQPNLRSIAYFKNGSYFYRFLSLTESFLFVNNVSGVDYKFYDYSYDDLFVKPWFFACFNEITNYLHLNIGHTIVDGFSMKLMEKLVKPIPYKDNNNVDILERTKIISNLMPLNDTNFINDDLKAYLDDCKRVINYQENKLQEVNLSNTVSTYILNLNKYNSIITKILSKINTTTYIYLQTIISKSLLIALNLNSICFNISLDIRQKKTILNNIVGMYVNVMPFMIKMTDNDLILNSSKKTMAKLLNYCDSCIYPYFNKDIPIMITNEYVEKINKNIPNKIQKNSKSNLSIFFVTGAEIKIILQRKKGFLENSIFNKFLEITCQELTKDFIYHYRNHNNLKHAPFNMTISSLLMKQALLTSTNISIKTNDINFTYQDIINIINERSCTLKEDYFKEVGEIIVQETIIPIEITREINDIFNILAILNCGACYNPIDYDLPLKRKEKYLNQSNAIFSIKKNTYTTKCVKSKEYKYFNRPIGTNLAYLIYTSGTTGEPKGICINQDSVVNMITESTKNFFFTTNSTVYQFTKLSFDNSILEIFGALCNGGAVYQSQIQYFDSSNFQDDILKKKITHAMLFPGLVSSFNIDEKIQMALLKYWIVGAEKLPKKLFNEMIKNNVLTIQNYGPTETTGYCIFKIMRSKDNPQNIGKPIKNMNTFVLKEKNIASCGELLVSGIGVTRGFINNKNNNNNFNGIWYKTGDIVEKTNSGDIIFVGRNDSQVKIRGFRIELSDIESTIDQLCEIKCSRVIFNDDKLYAIYVLYDHAKPISEELIKRHCNDNLPNYAVPNRFKKVEEIFLTKNMKLDKEKTLLLFKNNDNQEIIDDEESYTFLKIWRKHLNNSTITTTDKFFEVGGNSINSIQIMHETNLYFDPQIYVTDIYRYETIEEIVKLKKLKLKKINKQINSSHQNILPVNFNPNNIQLSFQQYQIYFLNQTIHYRYANIIFAEEININFNKNNRLQKAFMKLVANNIMLRTIFIEDKLSSTIKQRALSLTECFFHFQIQSFDNINQVKEDIQKNYNTKFNLSSEIPIKPYIYMFESKLITILLINHITTDAWTTKIIHSQMNEYLTMENEKIWSLSSTNKDIYSYIFYCYNQSLKYNTYNELANEYSFYLTNYQKYGCFFDVNIKQNILTTLYHQQQIKCYTKKYLLTGRESSQLLILASHYQVSPFVIFLSIFSYHLFLSDDIFLKSLFQQKTKLTNDSDKKINKQTLSILFPFFNRPLYSDENHTTIQNMSQTIGLFLNNLFLSINLDGYQKFTIKDIIKITKQSVDKCMKYKEVPWSFLKGKLRSHGSKCHLHDIYFNCRYEMEYSDGKEKSKLIEELESINKDEILDPIQLNIDKINDYFIFEYKIHPFLLNEREASSVFKNFEETLKNVLNEINEDKEENDSTNITLDIIKQVLSLPLTTKLQLNDNFYEIGGNSLSFIRLSHILREHLKVSISMDEFLSCETIEDIISLTKQNRQKDIQTIRVILFPGLFGSIHPYKQLINHLKMIFKNLEIISISYPKYLENFKDFPSFIEYLKITFQEKYCPLSDIPTLLIGTSFGGIVAYEFNLSALFIRNGFVINIDGIADNRWNKNFTYKEHEKIFSNYITNNDKSTDMVITNIPNKADVLKHSWNLLQLVINYLPTKNFNINITLFTSTTNQNPYLWWNSFTNVNLYPINSSHQEMLNDNNSKEMARCIKNFIF